MEPTEAKNTANEKLTHNKENTGKEAGTAPKEKIVLESGKNSSDKDKNGYKERLKRDYSGSSQACHHKRRFPGETASDPLQILALRLSSWDRSCPCVLIFCPNATATN